MQQSEELKEKVRKLPGSPGVYQFLDKEGTIIYIGKAKNLKSRVSSYFLSQHNHPPKTRVLVSKIADLHFIIVKSESDALLLENNLIKQYRPRYNVMLKDDKTYPWITITKEHFPRVFLTRRVIRNGSEYYGPYTSVKWAHLLLDLIKHLYPLRTCKLSLSPTGIAQNKFKVCLQAHIGNCQAPCTGGISEEEYQEWIHQIRLILKGNISSVVSLLQQKMTAASDALAFETAHEIKQAIEALKAYQLKSAIVRSSIDDLDVFSLIDDDKYVYVNYLRIIQGAVNQVHSVEIERKLDEPKESLLSYSILEIRQLVGSQSKNILVPFLPDIELEGLHYSIPQRGEKRQLLELSERNAGFFKADRERQRGTLQKENTRLHLLTTLKNELKLPALPHRMECFDNSNIQGTNPVASCVVFIDGKPAKKEYRHFHIKTVTGPDDFASMEEIVYRRYHRLLDEGKPLPELIVIDGGKGQLHAAVNSLQRLDIYGKVSIIGLAKRMEEIYYPEDSQPYILGKQSQALKVLMQIRDEAHRFGITFHRSLRSKQQIDSELNHIPGIGPATVTTLLRTFASVDAIRQASLEALAEAIGVAKGRVVFNYLRQSGTN